MTQNVVKLDHRLVRRRAICGLIDLSTSFGILPLKVGKSETSITCVFRLCYEEVPILLI